MNLAIKGHPTRGREVIQLIEMLGGNNVYNHDGSGEVYYYICTKNIISFDFIPADDYIVFTLEEFEEKFPYKVGDKVLYKIYGIYSKIKTMLWNVEKEQVFYRLDSNKLFVATADELKPRKEEIIEDKLEQITFDIPNGYEFFGINDDNQVVLAKKQPQYPKTYDECCGILQVIHIEWHGYLGEVLVPFQELLICRDAYWKIAGDWKPDFLNPTKEIRYFLFCTGTTIENGQGLFPTNKILIFPTEEMRDAFYENFKDLINQCKELL